MLFFCKGELSRFYYADEGKDRETRYEYERGLESAPKFGVFNKDQSQFIVTSEDEIRYVDLNRTKEIDLAVQEGVAGIESILADDGDFYVLANKRDHKLGYYLFTVDQKDPEGNGPNSPSPRSPEKYLINWNNKLDIGDCAMHIMEEADQDIGYSVDGVNHGGAEGKDKSNKKTKSIVVCYKSIGINTFNVFVIDLQTRLIKYWHESN